MREEVQEYACLGWRNNSVIIMHTHINQLTKWKCSTWFRCEINYEDKSSTISTSFVFWFEASLSPDTQLGSETKKKWFSEKYHYQHRRPQQSYANAVFSPSILLWIWIFSISLSYRSFSVREVSCAVGLFWRWQCCTGCWEILFPYSGFGDSTAFQWLHQGTTHRKWCYR